MKVIVKYEELSSSMSFVNTILGDKTIKEDFKNAMFLVRGGKVELVGYSALAFTRVKLESSEVIRNDGEGSDWFFQVKAGELNKIIGSYTSLFKTHVDKVEFSKDGSRVKLSVYEEPNSEEESDKRLAQVSSFRMNSPVIIESIKKEVLMDFPSESETLLTGDISLYVSSLFPLVTNESASSPSSTMYFDDEYVFVISSSASSFFKNKLPDAFKGYALGYSAVNFLKKVVESCESISVCKEDRYICLETENVQAFLRHKKMGFNYKGFVQRFSKDNGIVIDRLYFKDVLKRMSIRGGNGSISVKGENLELSNEEFFQVIPIEKSKGDVEGVSFKVPTSLLSKAIIGVDEVFPGSLRMYFVKGSPGYSLFISDGMGAWFSTLQVR